jgi:hypothetical protein
VKQGGSSMGYILALLTCLLTGTCEVSESKNTYINGIVCISPESAKKFVEYSRATADTSDPDSMTQSFIDFNTKIDSSSPCVLIGEGLIDKEQKLQVNGTEFLQLEILSKEICITGASCFETTFFALVQKQ